MRANPETPPPSAPKERFFLVVNPRSAAGAVAREWHRIAAAVRSACGTFEHAFTTGPGHATLLTRSALREGYSVIVSVGGDGTLNEVVNGFFEGGAPVCAGASLGFIPVGTGGDFRKTLGIPVVIEDAARVLSSKASKTLDLGRLSLVGPHGEQTERYFINIASFGMGGLVDSIVNSSSKVLGGKISFLLATGRAALRYRNQAVRLTLDGGKAFERRVFNVAVANGRFFGGGMQIAPEADPCDGLFDVVILGNLAMPEILLNLRSVYEGTHLGLPKVEHFRASHVRAEPVEPGEHVLLDVDGEQPGSLPAEFTVVKQALAICVPG